MTEANTDPATALTGPSLSAGNRISTLHVIVISLSLMMTVGAWLFSKNQIETRIATRFDASVDSVLGLIEDRMKKYEDGLWAGVSAIESHGGDMTHAEWRIFANTLKLESKYPGINGIGVIHYLSNQTLPPYLATQRQARPDYAIKPPHDEGVYMPISYIEPEASNAAAVGLDVAHERNRRTAALASRDTGTAQITGPIVLVQDSGNTPGFLFYAPYYRGQPPMTVLGRRANIQGAVYAPFVVRKLMEGLLSKDLRDVRFSITDTTELIYDEHSADDPYYDPDPMFARQVEFDLYGRTWMLDIRTNLAFRKVNTYAQPTLILIGGLMIEALIISLLVLMSRANRQAVAYADRVTAALRTEKDKLSRTNEELEQFAYVASHDLRTPIRGIGGLTEMVQEDLEEYLNSADADPEVGHNLNRILERVERMNDLTRGIMEFSRIGRHDFGGKTLVFRDVIDTLISDFRLDPGQLELVGDVDSVDIDAFNLRRVLDNLVSNAIKYHDGADPLKIRISVRSEGNRCKVSVQDNGPGIDPRFHSRIFEMFKTLRTGDAPESTGIGLAIVKKSIERHGGEISLISNVGEGAEFSFTWPTSSGSQVFHCPGKAA